MNNFTYGMTGGQVTPTTPTTANASTTPYGNYETPFSLPFLVDAAGATYVARWTSLHARNITKSIGEALKHKGFSFIEVITPCTTLYQRRNRLGDGLDAMEYYHDDADIQHGADTRTVDIGYQGKIAMGKFVDRPRADLSRRRQRPLRQRHRRRLRTLRQDADGEKGRGRSAQERGRHGRGCRYRRGWLLMWEIKFSGFGGQGIVRCALDYRQGGRALRR